MDIQLKRGMLDICVLSSLLREDSYGYKIIKDLQPYMEILFLICRNLTSAFKVQSPHALTRIF